MIVAFQLLMEFVIVQLGDIWMAVLARFVLVVAVTVLELVLVFHVVKDIILAQGNVYHAPKIVQAAVLQLTVLNVLKDISSIKTPAQIAQLTAHPAQH
jgi:hypothetical protein